VEFAPIGREFHNWLQWKGGRLINLKIRENRVSIRLTDKEKAYLEKQARTAGLKIEPYIRALIAGNEIKARPPEIWVEVVRQLSAIGNNINQNARIANATGTISQNTVNALIENQNKIWELVKGL
jgi:ApbE superfamily uncharacterized protein (UPF0280 family)